MERMQDFWAEIAAFLEEGEQQKIRRVAFIGIGHPDNHWTVVTRVTPAQPVTFFDLLGVETPRASAVHGLARRRQGEWRHAQARYAPDLPDGAPKSGLRRDAPATPRESHARAPHLGPRASRLARTPSPALASPRPTCRHPGERHRPDLVMSKLDQVLSHLDSNLDGAVERLFTFLRIPSISTDPAYKKNCVEAAEHLKADIATLGFEASLRPTKGHPVVMGHAKNPAGRMAASVRTCCSTAITTCSRSIRSICGRAPPSSRRSSRSSQAAR